MESITPVTVITPDFRKDRAFRFVITIVIVELIIGISTLASVIAAGSSAVSYVFPVIVVLIGVGMLVSMPVMRRAYVRQRNWTLTVTPETISWRLPKGHGREWRRTDGDRVRYIGGRRPRVTVGADSIGLSSPVVRLVDVAAFRSACMEAGWSWQEGKGPVYQAMPSPDSEINDRAESDTVSLREGRQRIDRRDYVRLMLWFGFFGVCMALATAWTVSQAQYWVVLPILVVGVGLIAVIGARENQRLAMSLNINQARIMLRVGPTNLTVDRLRVGRVLAAKKTLMFQNDNKQLLFRVAMGSHRDEILGHLKRHGWVVEER